VNQWQEFASDMIKFFLKDLVDKDS
jgi:hypothetical protein